MSAYTISLADVAAVLGKSIATAHIHVSEPFLLSRWRVPGARERAYLYRAVDVIERLRAVRSDITEEQIDKLIRIDIDRRKAA